MYFCNKSISMLPCVFQCVFHMYRYLYISGWICSLKIAFCHASSHSSTPNSVLNFAHTSTFMLPTLGDWKWNISHTPVRNTHWSYWCWCFRRLKLVRAHVDKLQFLPFRRLPSIHFVYLQNTCITHPTSEPSRESLNSHLMSSESSLSPLGEKDGRRANVKNWSF